MSDEIQIDVIEAVEAVALDVAEAVEVVEVQVTEPQGPEGEPGPAGAGLIGKVATLFVPLILGGIVDVVHPDLDVATGDIIQPSFAAVTDAENDMEEIQDSSLRLFAAAQAGSIRFSIVSDAAIAGPFLVQYTIHKP